MRADSVAARAAGKAARPGAGRRTETASRRTVAPHGSIDAAVCCSALAWPSVRADRSWLRWAISALASETVLALSRTDVTRCTRLRCTVRKATSSLPNACRTWPAASARAMSSRTRCERRSLSASVVWTVVAETATMLRMSSPTAARRPPESFSSIDRSFQGPMRLSSAWPRAAWLVWRCARSAAGPCSRTGQAVPYAGTRPSRTVLREGVRTALPAGWRAAARPAARVPAKDLRTRGPGLSWRHGQTARRSGGRTKRTRLCRMCPRTMVSPSVSSAQVTLGLAALIACAFNVRLKK